MMRRFALVLALSLAAVPAVAAPPDGERTVASARLRLADVADVPPELASIELGKAPRAGSSRIVTAEEMRQAIVAARGDKVVVPPLPRTVKVVRKSRKVDKAELAETAQAWLGTQALPRGARVVGATARGGATLPEGHDGTRVDLPRLPRKAGKLVVPATLRFLEGDEEVASVLVEVTLELPPAAALPDVKKGTKVSLVVVRGSVEVRATAIVNEDADVGDVVTVTVADSKKTLRARLTQASPPIATESE